MMDRRSFLALLAAPALPAASRQTAVSVDGDRFMMNGKPTYEGRLYKGMRIEGLLMNSRMVQGIFDDLNPETRSRWAYPDTKRWDPDRNTREFGAAMPQWRSFGLLAFTINLQGGSIGDDDRLPQVEADFAFALQLASQAGCRLLELRAASSHFRLRRRLGDAAGERSSCAEALGRFTEGINSPAVSDPMKACDLLAKQAIPRCPSAISCGARTHSSNPLWLARPQTWTIVTRPPNSSAARFT